MPFTGSSTVLANLIVANMQPLLNPDADPIAQQRLLDTANALATAIEQWILTASTGSVVAQVTPGIPVATAGSPAAQTGATTAPGVVTQPTSKLI